jgi:NAD-dependent deacetylase
MKDKINTAAEKIRNAGFFTAFTGAGISVESGIPPFRGKNGLWNRYDPALFEIEYYLAHPAESWKLIVQLFFETFERAKPNPAHHALAALEKMGILKALITQNIDNLHYRAGSRKILEYHGNSRNLVCLMCGKKHPVTAEMLRSQMPECSCSGLLKPDFIFFGEDIPPDVSKEAERISHATDVLLIIGTTGLVYPSALIPLTAKENGAFIIEVNTDGSEYTHTLTDLFLQGPGAGIVHSLRNEVAAAVEGD